MSLNGLQKLSHNPVARSIVRKLGVSNAAQQIYYRIMHRGVTARFDQYGEEVRFVCREVEDLRSLEQWVLEPALGRLLRMATKDDVALDVGANRGVYSMFLAKKVRQVVACEPEKRTAKEFLENIALNRLCNCSLINKALGDTTSEANLYVENSIGTMRLGAVAHPNEKREVQRVEVVRGDDLVDRQLLPQPTVIKIDVEGFEGAVLRGLERTLRHVRLVLCEIHPNELPAGDSMDGILQLLKRAGLEIVLREPRSPEVHVFAARPAGRID
jgi:FkbM family methyltransferase